MRSRRHFVAVCLCLVGFGLFQAFASSPIVSGSNQSGSRSNPASPSNNPLPVLTSVSPDVAYVNGASFTLTATGSGFIKTSAIYWNNVAITTTYVSSTKLTAKIPAADLANSGSSWVSVVNPAPGGGSSQTIYFYVVALDPSISNISPSSVLAASAPSPIIVNGSNFMKGATVQWNGKSVATTYLSTTQLQFTPTKTQLGSASIVQLSVLNPSPGGISPALDFDVTYSYKATVLDLPANDLVWDPYAQRIYASIPSSYGVNGNTIAVINPTTGAITGYYYAGSEPTMLALTSDSQYLYAGLNGNGSVQRLILPNFSPDIDVSLGSGCCGINTAQALAVSPSDDHTFAVAEGSTYYTNGLYFYTDSTQLPNYITYPYMNNIAFVNSSTLYGYYSGTVSQVNVDSNGGTVGQQWNGLVQGSNIVYSGGLIYGNDGQVLDPSTGLLLGSYDFGSSCCGSSLQMLANSAVDRVFALGITPFFPNYLGITSYDLAKFTPLAVANLSQLSGSVMPTLISWGNNGLAFTLQSGCCGTTSTQTVILQSSSLVAPSSGTTNPLPAAQSLAPANATHGGRNFVLTLDGNGFVPATQVTWNGTSLATSYVSSTQLNIYVPAGSIASAGTAKVVASNPGPGGGTSASVTFTIN